MLASLDFVLKLLHSKAEGLLLLQTTRQLAYGGDEAERKGPERERSYNIFNNFKS